MPTTPAYLSPHVDTPKTNSLTMASRVLPCATSTLLLLLLIVAPLGCGTTRDKTATDQLLLSDAVDRAVANIDFSPLQDERVYLNTEYVQSIKGQGFVNDNYIISSLRQQMVLAGCLLQDNVSEATYIVEARVGALGSDGYDVNFGIPPSQGLNAAAALVPGTPPVPALPEISLGRRSDDTAAAKIAVFAYHRETRQPVWQSGLSVAKSTASGRWIFGAGPFQSGTIHQGTSFAGANLAESTPLRGRRGKEEPTTAEQAYRSPGVLDERLTSKLYDPQRDERDEGRVQQAQHFGDSTDESRAPNEPDEGSVSPESREDGR